MSEKKEPRLSRVRITVTAAATHPDVLSVKDAMQQVLDFFDLLTPEGDENFLWNLKLASTNSPLTVEGEAYSPRGDALAVAKHQTALIESSLRSLSKGRPPSQRLSPRRRETVRRIMKRNMNGIGKTEAVFSDFEPLLVTPSVAATSVQALETSDFGSLLLKDRAREEIGSLEGTLVSVGNDYKQPSVLIRERRTGVEINCRVSEELRASISASMSIDDVWSNRRVMVKGRIRYDSDGSIMRVMGTESILPLKPRAVSVEEIADTDFTSGTPVHDYLNRLREGDFG